MLLQRILGIFLFITIITSSLLASPADDLQSASNQGDVAFVLVTEPGSFGVKRAKSIINKAMRQVQNSVLIELNRALKENLSLVRKYRLSGAQVPFILVFASNGAMAGGNLGSKLTAQHLVNMVPSPKKAEVLKATQEGQAVFLTVTRDGMSAKSDVADCYASASGQLQGKCASINVNMDDEAEAAFLKELKVNTRSTKPVTVVFNAQGQVTGSFSGPVDVAKLVQAATKKVKSGCCPPGSGKSCGPTKKTKKTK